MDLVISCSYEKEKLSIKFKNRGRHGFWNSLSLSIDSVVINEFPHSIISVEADSEKIISIDFIPSKHKHLITVMNGKSKYFEEELVIPEFRLIYKMNQDKELVVYNPYDNKEIKDLIIKIFFWESEFLTIGVSSIKPGSSTKIKVDNINDIVEVFANNTRIEKY